MVRISPAFFILLYILFDFDARAFSGKVKKLLICSIFALRCSLTGRLRNDIIAYTDKMIENMALYHF